MYGVKIATAFFITRALFTTCGKNILPEPKSSPTIFIPSIKGPSITSIGLSNFSLASSTSTSKKDILPLTKENDNLSSTDFSLHDKSSFLSFPFPLIVSASDNNLSVAWLSLFNKTSSTPFNNFLGISS